MSVFTSHTQHTFIGLKKMYTRITLDRHEQHRYIFGVCFIGFVAPFGLISIQGHKYKINGPWDIAELKIRRKS